MDAHAMSATGPATRSSGTLLVLTIVGSSILAGVGLLGMFYWLITLRWLYFLSLGPLIGGAYLLFTRATGVDHA